MRILMTASEMTPYAKTGGLADVLGALPPALADLGHRVAVMLPFYRQIDGTTTLLDLAQPQVLVDLSAGKRMMRIWAAPPQRPTKCGGSVRVYLIDDRALFDRPQLYGENGREYPDNALRFAYFSLACLWAIQGLGLRPELIHCHDWQTAFIPLFRRHHPAVACDPKLARIPLLFSIHNLSYQGTTAPYLIDQLGLPGHLARYPSPLEFYGKINPLKSGLILSDWLTTVSPRYAAEIQTPEFGCGLEGVVRQRKNILSGILNGIDIESWNPATDGALAANYSAADPRGKAECKRFLQRRYGLPSEPDTPLMGMISRLTDQKGIDLLQKVLPRILAREMAQFVLLGSGQLEYHRFFEGMAAEFRDRVAIELGFDDRLAHQIEAGADIFLMPSRFEPCGLNQMYSLRYGTVPVVHRTGGLADTIIDATETNQRDGTATGFVFEPYTTSALEEAIGRCLECYRKRPGAWRKLIANGMIQDHGWDRAARQYENVMRRVAGHD